MPPTLCIPRNPPRTYLPCHAPPCHAMPCRTLPRRTLPCLTSRHLSLATCDNVKYNRLMDAITPEQCRAARALLDWTREQLSVASGVPVRTLADFETGATAPRAATRQKLAEAFGREGIAFVAVYGTAGGATLIR